MDYAIAKTCTAIGVMESSIMLKQPASPQFVGVIVALPIIVGELVGVESESPKICCNRVWKLYDGGEFKTGVLGPVDLPPCSFQRPLASAFWQDVPRRVLAPHRSPSLA
ncbi:MAG: hypothetical protein ACYCY5_03295 [Sulfuricella sp.]